MTDPWAPAQQSDPWAGMSSQQSDPWAASAPQQQAAPIPQHQMEPPSADEFFAGGAGVKGFSYDGTPPIRNGGRIVDLPPLKQKTDFDTGELLFWKDRRPRWVMPVPCQTAERVDADDDGVRAHFLEYKKLKSAQDAVKRAGRDKLEVGGALYQTYTGPVDATGKPVRGAAKDYTSEYFPPGVPDPYAGQQQSPALATPPPVAVPPQQAQIAMAAGASPELARALCDAGMTVEEAQRLASLAAGWQGAQASQIMPYIRRAASTEPPF